MAIQSHLENLREKPEHVRKRIAFWSSFGITAVVFAFWLASSTGFSLYSPESRSAVIAAVDRAGSPAQSLIAGVGAFFVDIKELIFGSKKVNYAEVEVSPGR